MFATSLGPHDACFVAAANENKNSGYMVNWWIPAALQKEITGDRPVFGLVFKPAKIPAKPLDWS